MTKRDERAGGAEPPRTPRTRVVSEAVVAAVPDTPQRPRTRVVAEAIVAAIPEGGGAAEGGAGGQAESEP